MIFARTSKLLSHLRLATVALLPCAALALLPGCKGNTTSAAYVEHAVGKPPVVMIHPAAYDVSTATDLSSSLWQQAQWLTLTAPANTVRTTAPARAAVTFDQDALYVYFVSVRQPVAKDSVSLFLDTTRAGQAKELLKVTVDLNGVSMCTWLRSSAVSAPREDGSPDMGRSVTATPNVLLDGLKTHVEQTNEGGSAVWTALITLPFKSLPGPMQVAAVPPAANTRFKFNLLRNVSTPNGGSERAEQLQANLSPVYVGAQEFSPYRLADLIIGQ